MGLRVLSNDGGVVKIIFSAIGRRKDGSSIAGHVKSYNVYRSSAISGVWACINVIGSGGALEFTDAYSSGSMNYYRVCAMDKYNQEGDGLMIISCTDVLTVMSPDGQAQVTFDNESKNFLYADTNELEADVDVRLDRDSDEGADTICSYRLHAIRRDTNEELNDILIPRTRLGPRIVISYAKAAAALESPARAPAVRLPAMYWNNSVKWVKVNGELDADAGEIALRTKLLGRYAVRYAARSDKFTITGVEPRIFSPDVEGSVVSRVYFYVDNPNVSSVRSTIFDIEGRVIRTSIPRELETVFYWDGRDNEDKIVPSGVYIYQLEADGRSLNGTIVVAR